MRADIVRTNRGGRGKRGGKKNALEISIYDSEFGLLVFGIVWKQASLTTDTHTHTHYSCMHALRPLNNRCHSILFSGNRTMAQRKRSWRINFFWFQQEGTSWRHQTRQCHLIAENSVAFMIIVIIIVFVDYLHREFVWCASERARVFVWFVRTFVRFGVALWFAAFMLWH